MEDIVGAPSGPDRRECPRGAPVRGGDAVPLPYRDIGEMQRGHSGASRRDGGRPRSTTSSGARIVPVVALLLLAACTAGPGGPAPDAGAPATDVPERLGRYTSVRLTADLSSLDDRQRAMLPLLVEAARQMDVLFWKQAYGDRDELLARIDDADLRRLVEINYGPWDRLADNEPFVAGVADKPPGANFYPPDMTRQEFEAATAESEERAAALRNLYTLVRRDEQGRLTAIPYHEAFAEQLTVAAARLREAAELADDPGLRRYLELRAAALLDDDYLPSDLAWMDMKSNTLEIVIGPIETYEDRLFGYKASYEALVFVKDQEWSRRLARYAEILPDLQRGLPVPDEYKREVPGTGSELNAYDAVFYAGEANAGPKTIAVNLPNDEEVQLQKGTRRLQIKNAMRAKFDEILVPIADQLIDPEQRGLVGFDAFFANTMFHEVAHGLGIKNTLDGSSTVRQALREQASALEEGKADVLGLYMVDELIERREFDGALDEHLVTFFASIFRSIRFGSASAHGTANLVRFNFFRERDAFHRDPAAGTYRLDFEAARAATDALSELILRLQGDGDYEGVVQLVDRYGTIGDDLRADLDRLSEAGIPVDIVFDQGVEVLGLGGR